MSDERKLIGRFFLVAAIITALLAGGGAFFAGAAFAFSVFLGAVLVCASFFLLQRDIRALFDRLTLKGLSGSGKVRAQFFLKFLGRFAALALLLFFILTKITIQPLGLVLGLSTIMVSAIIVGVAEKKKRLSGIL